MWCFPGWSRFSGTPRCADAVRRALLPLAVILLSSSILGAASLPLAFEPNLGQARAGVRYLARTSGRGLLFVGQDGFEFIHPGRPAASIRFLNSRRATLSSEEALPGRSNYFSGPNPEASGIEVPQFGRVLFHGIYPGIDAALHGMDGSLEYDFLLAPHAEPDRILLGLSGNAVIENGELVLRSGAEEIRQHAPEAYQQRNGRRQPVACHYRLVRPNQAGLDLGAHDPDLPVVIDPVMWVTYLGGSDATFGSGLAVDAEGNTYSAASGLEPSGGEGVTVIKLNPQGTEALFTTTIGAPGSSYPSAIVLDSAGFIYVAGTTDSTAFPTTPLAYQTSGAGFLFKLAPDGSKIQYSTRLHALPAAIAVDTSGRVYLTGTASSDFQTTPGVFQPQIAAGECSTTSNVTPSVPCPDAFVLKLNSGGTAAEYATFLGGTYADQGSAIAVDLDGAAHITGATGSNDFPLAGGGTQSSFHGLISVGPLWFGDAFAAELDPAGRSLFFSTYLGGSGPDQGFGIGVDSLGYTYVAGQTSSTDFPVTKGAYRTSFLGAAPQVPQLGLDGFVTKLNPDGSIRLSTYFQGTGGMVVDSNGNAYLATLQFATGTVPVCNQRGVWVQVLRTDGVLIQPSGYPSPGSNGSSTIGLDAEGNAYVTGTTNSLAFLATPGAYRTQFNGDHAAYAGKVDFAAALPRAISCVINAASLAAGNPRNYSSDGAVSPGEIVSLYGNDIGPSTPGGGVVLRGRFTQQIGDTQILFDGIPAPLLYAGPGQINAVVPFALQNPTHLVLWRSGVSTGPIALPVVPAVPGVFLSGDPLLARAAALNQDGSPNSPSNPAARGSVVTFFATGAGTFTPAESDGKILPLTLPLPVPAMGASVLIGGKQAPVQYAGAAPGSVAGLLQVNAVVPGDAAAGPAVPLQLYIGDFASQLALLPGQVPLSIAVR